MSRRFRSSKSLYSLLPNEEINLRRGLVNNELKNCCNTSLTEMQTKINSCKNTKLRKCSSIANDDSLSEMERFHQMNLNYHHLNTCSKYRHVVNTAFDSLPYYIHDDPIEIQIRENHKHEEKVLQDRAQECLNDIASLENKNQSTELVKRTHKKSRKRRQSRKTLKPVQYRPGACYKCFIPGHTPAECPTSCNYNASDVVFSPSIQSNAETHKKYRECQLLADNRSCRNEKSMDDIHVLGNKFKDCIEYANELRNSTTFTDPLYLEYLLAIEKFRQEEKYCN